MLNASKKDMALHYGLCSVFISYDILQISLKLIRLFFMKCTFNLYAEVFTGIISLAMYTLYAIIQFSLITTENIHTHSVTHRQTWGGNGPGGTGG